MKFGKVPNIIHLVFGLWRVCFPPVLIRTARRLPVEALRRGGVWVTLTGYPRHGDVAPGPGPAALLCGPPLEGRRYAEPVTRGEIKRGEKKKLLNSDITTARHARAMRGPRRHVLRCVPWPGAPDQQQTGLLINRFAGQIHAPCEVPCIGSRRPCGNAEAPGRIAASGGKHVQEKTTTACCGRRRSIYLASARPLVSRRVGRAQSPRNAGNYDLTQAPAFVLPVHAPRLPGLARKSCILTSFYSNAGGCKIKVPTSRAH